MRYLIKLVIASLGLAISVAATAEVNSYKPGHAYDSALSKDGNTIHLNPADKSGEATLVDRKDDRKPGLLYVQRAGAGLAYTGIPTMFGLPVALTPEDLKAGKVDVAFLGVPMDNGSYGRPGTSHGPRHLRLGETIMPWGADIPVWTSELQVDPFSDLVMVDYSDVQVDPNSIEKSLPNIRRHVRDIASTGAIPLIMGGNHSIFYPIVLALTDVYGLEGFTAIHLDAHTDMSSENFGHYVTIGNGVRLSVEEGLVKGKDMLQAGQRSVGYGPDKLAWYRETGSRIYWKGEIETRCLSAVLEDMVNDIRNGPGKVYISVDVDVLDAGIAPGTTAPVIGGWSTLDLMTTIISLLVAGYLIAFDVVYYNPLFDNYSRTTATIMNQMYREVVSAIALKRKGINDPFYFHPEILGSERTPQ